MILSPAQLKTLQDALALGHFLETDPAFNELGADLREVSGEILDLMDRLSEREELSAPF